MNKRFTSIVAAGILVLLITGCVQSGLVSDVQPGAGQKANQTSDSATQISPMPETTLLETSTNLAAGTSTQSAVQGSNTTIVITSGTQVAPQGSNTTIISPAPGQSSPTAGSTPANLPGSKGSAEPYNPLPFPGSSGIVGKVLIGPSCPVQTAGSTQCDDKPFQATISILNTKGQVLSQVESDIQGNFVVSLAPGTYILQPVTKAIYPHGTTLTVTVLQGQITQMTIYFDSGIR
jgi:hypothetical protein